MNKEENKHRLRDEYIKLKKEQFNKKIDEAFRDKPYVFIYIPAYNTWMLDCSKSKWTYHTLDGTFENIKGVLSGELIFRKKPIVCSPASKLFYRLFECEECGCHSFYQFNHRAVCSNCFKENILIDQDYLIPFENEEKGVYANERWTYYCDVYEDVFNELLEEVKNKKVNNNE